MNIAKLFIMIAGAFLAVSGGCFAVLPGLMINSRDPESDRRVESFGVVTVILFAISMLFLFLFFVAMIVRGTMGLPPL